MTLRLVVVEEEGAVVVVVAVAFAAFVAFVASDAFAFPFVVQAVAEEVVLAVVHEGDVFSVYVVRVQLDQPYCHCLDSFSVSLALAVLVVLLLTVNFSAFSVSFFRFELPVAVSRFLLLQQYAFPPRVVVSEHMISDEQTDVRVV